MEGKLNLDWQQETSLRKEKQKVKADLKYKQERWKAQPSFKIKQETEGKAVLVSVLLSQWNDCLSAAGVKMDMFGAFISQGCWNLVLSQ